MRIVIGVFLVAAAMVGFSTAEDEEWKPHPCPMISCPEDDVIPDECRQQNFFIGIDGETQCRSCDSNNCTQEVVVVSKRSRYSAVCPAIMCPYIFIPDHCRKANYVLGIDGKTKCRVCDSDRCKRPLLSKRSADNQVCPQIGCPAIFIRPECRQKNYILGLDGKTRCRVCDTDKCLVVEEPPSVGKRSADSQVCPQIGCPFIYIRPECRQKNYITGLDGKTKCRVCDTDKCVDETPLVSKRSADSQVCPLTGCPFIYIRPECRQKNYVTGSDGTTRCRVCDTDKCADKPVVSKRSADSHVCPLTGCPFIFIRPECRQKNYVTGSDGKTRCRVCDTDKCANTPPLFS